MVTRCVTREHTYQIHDDSRAHFFIFHILKEKCTNMLFMFVSMIVYGQQSCKMASPGQCCGNFQYSSVFLPHHLRFRKQERAT